MAVKPTPPPTQHEMDVFNAHLFDGLIATDGTIMNAVPGRGLMNGRMRDASPEYQRFLAGVTNYATMYPFADPRTWVPLAQAYVQANSDPAQAAMLADYQRLSAEGQNVDAAGTKTSNGAVVDSQPATDTTTTTPTAANGTMTGPDTFMWGGQEVAIKPLGTLGGGGDQPAPDTLGLFYNLIGKHVPEPLRHAADNTSQAVGYGIHHTLGSGLIKGVSRNFFAAANMPLQAIEGNWAAVTGDLKDGDYKSAILHSFAMNPVFEAAFIGAENVTGTQFYREGGAEQGVWSQTDMGQKILDLQGQGRGEQFGLYNDPKGVQSSEGDGFFIRSTDNSAPTGPDDPSTVAEWQRAARLHANTLVEATPAPDVVSKQLTRIAKMSSLEEAQQYAKAEYGLSFDETTKTWLKPAQGATVGRSLAIQFYDPNTSAYNNFSGIVDFGFDLVADPTNYIPGGAIKKGVLALRAGKLIIDTGDKPQVFAKGVAIVADHQQVVDRLVGGETVAEMQKDGSQLMVRLRSGTELPASPEVAAQIAASGNTSRGARKLFLQKNIIRDIGTGEDATAMLTEQAQAAAEAGRIADPRVDMADGMFYSAPSAMRWWDSEIGQATAQALADNADWVDISVKLGGRIEWQDAMRLAKTKTAEDVKQVMAPILGLGIRRERDMLGVVEKLPRYSLTQKLWRATDFAQVSQRVRKIKRVGEFMPLSQVDANDPNALVENAVRWLRIVLPGALDKEAIRNKLAEFGDIIPGGGAQEVAKSYQILHGARGEQVVRSADGALLASHEDLLVDRAAGLSDEQILEKYPRGADFSTEFGGGLFALAREEMIARGIDPEAAKAATRWSDRDHHMIAYARDQEGRPIVAEGASHSQPMFEEDLMKSGMRFPDPLMAREANNWVGKLRESGLDAAKIDQVMTSMMWEWKRVTLMAGGARVIPYITKATSDGLIAMSLSGGTSMFTRPVDIIPALLGHAFYKAYKNDQTGSAAIKFWSAVADNPLIKAAGSHQQLYDMTGEAWANRIADIILNKDTDISNLALKESLNIGAGSRGVRNVDINYAIKQGLVVPTPFPENIAEYPKQWKTYKEGLLNQFVHHMHNPLIQMIASGKATRQQLLDYVARHARDERSHVAVTPQIAKELSTPEGVQRFVDRATVIVRGLTGDDPELKDALANGGMIKTEGGRTSVIDAKNPLDQKPSQAWDEMLARAHARTGMFDPRNGKHAGLPTDTYLPRKDFHGPSAWNAWNERFFHWAGVAEDTLVRSPEFKRRYRERFLELADNLTASEKAKAIQTANKIGDPKLAQALEKVRTQGALTVDMLDIHAKRMAQKDLFDVAYEAANRRDWAFAMRIIAPFAQAAVNGMYRWTKAAVQNPESTYRVMRTLKFLSGPESASLNTFLGTGYPNGQPFFFTDPTSGTRMVSVPIIGSAVSRLTGVHTGFSFGANVGLNLGFQNAEQALSKERAGAKGQFWTMAMFPGVGPVVEFPLSFVHSNNSAMLNYIFPYGKPTGSFPERIADSLLPAVAKNLFGMFAPTADQTKQAAATQMEYTAILAAQSKIPWDQMTGPEGDRMKLAIIQHASDLTTTMRWIDFFASTITPTQATGDPLFKDPNQTPDHFIFAHALAGYWRKYLTGNGGDYYKAQAEFVNDFGLSALMLATPSTERFGGPPPTKTADELFSKYPDLYHLYGPGLEALLPQTDGTNVDWPFYAQQKAMGEVRDLSFTERIDKATQLILEYAKNNTLNRIANMPGLTDVQRQISANGLEKDLVAQGYLNEINARSPESRDVVANSALKAASDPRMWQFIGGKKTAQLVVQYLTTRQEMETQLSNGGATYPDLAKLTTTGAPQREQLFNLGEYYSTLDPNFFVLWNRTFRSEVAPQ